MRVHFIEKKWIEELSVELRSILATLTLHNHTIHDIKHYSYNFPTPSNPHGVMHVAVIHYDK